MLKKCKVIQSGYKDCAASCLLSIIRFYGGDVSLDELSFIMKTDKNGTNAYNLIECAKQIGFSGYGIKCSFEEFLKLEQFPCIVHVIKNNMYHFIVVYSINKKIYCMDPSEGFVKLSYDAFKEIFLGTIVILYPCKKLGDLAKNGFSSYIISTLKLLKKDIIKVSIYTLIVILLSFVSYILLRDIINLTHENLSTALLLSFLLLTVLKCIFDYIRANKLIFVNREFSKSINSKFFRHLFYLPYLFFKNKTTAEVVNRTNDINRFRDLISFISINLVSDALFLLFSMLLLLYMNYNLFLIVLLFMVIFVIVSFIFAKASKGKIKDMQVEDDIYNKNISESILSYESNRNINVISYFIKRNDISFNRFLKANSSYEKILSKELFIKDILVSFCQMFVIIGGLYYVRNDLMSVGDYFVFNSLIIYFIEPIKNIMNIVPNINYAKEIYNRINSLILMKKDDYKDSFEAINGDIRIVSLGFSYNNKDILFENINMFIKEKSHIMLYSSSGSGKSTLLKIILKYLEDYKGNVYIGNRNIKDINYSLISNSFVYVSQNSYLINDTLKNNIVYFRDVDDDAYEDVLKICNISSIRDRSALRDNYLIEENGFNLSGGERQKVMLARSLLKKSNYIILDEALSEVGPDEEKMITQNIREYYKDKTIIYVSHKKELCDCFEKIYNIKEMMDV